jgi:HNH endonuclease
MPELRRVPDHDGYFAGDDGEIYSELKRGPGKARYELPILIKGHPNQDGYQQHILSVNRVKMTRLAHYLVLLAFHGPRPEGCESRHGPGGKLDNRPSNLCWGTHQENIDDNLPQGKICKGDSHGSSRLSAASVIAMRTKWGQDATITVRELSSEYRVGAAGVYYALRGETWKHVGVTSEAPDLTGVVENYQRGLAARSGPKVRAAILTTDEVREIRKAYSTGGSKILSELMRRYKVSSQCLDAVVKRRTWPHIS